MNEGKIKCPVCKGLRCVALVERPYLKRKDEYFYKLCYYHNTDCGMINCLHRCASCKGVGYIDWVDRFFIETSEIQKAKLQKIFNILNDIPVKSRIVMYDRKDYHNIKKILKNMIKDE